MDDKVLDFLDKIKLLFTNVYLDIPSIQLTNLRIVLAHLLPMLASIRGIQCSNECIQLFARQFSGILTPAKELHLYKMAELASVPACLDWLCSSQDFVGLWPRFFTTLADSKTIIAIVDDVHKVFRN